MACNTFTKELERKELGFYAYTYEDKMPDNLSMSDGRKVVLPLVILKITPCFIRIRYGDDVYRVKRRQDGINREYILINDEFAVYCDHYKRL